MATVEVTELVVRYRERVAVDRVSFTADAGRVLALLGPNGAGKTSTVETLEGYRARAAGAVRVLRLDPRRDYPALPRRVGLVLQAGGVYAGVRVAEAVREFAPVHGGAD